jgi:ectoine hydroxylase-related dioxygenase (phytanoyl-CoA dioxygenase family)
MTSFQLSSNQLQQWETDGYLLLQNMIPQSAIEKVCNVFSQVVDQMLHQLKTEGVIEDEGKELPFETRFAQVAGQHANRFGRSWRRSVSKPEVFRLHQVEALVGVIQQLTGTGTDVIGHPVFNARPKLPNQQLTVVPWHQDSGYFGPETEKSLIITAWIPLVSVDIENGCIQIAAGSHRLGLIDHHIEDREGRFLEVDDEKVDASRIVTCPMDTGDVLLFHNLTLHRSLPNVSQIIRWAIDIRYFRDGDNPGKIYWPDPQFKWIIRSQRQPETTLEEWIDMVEKQPW